MADRGARVKAALFWDIDGTLLTTGRAGVYALEAALEEICGVTADLHELATAGLTDAEVVGVALRAVGREDGPETIVRFLRAYERHLPASLHRRRGRVLDGVIEILDDLGGRDDVAVYLLTGNTPAGARAKLAHYGLDGYFTRGGSFCDPPGDRVAIARRALGLVDGAEQVYVIGDTSHDVRCGKAIGARTVAVASGPAPRDELVGAEPWLLLDRLPDPARFRRLLELD
jgi:phosphoglycolate phosphatase